MSSSSSSSILKQWLLGLPSTTLPRILLLDGGVSTHLQSRGATFAHRALWSSSLLLTEPARIRQGHADWLENNNLFSHIGANGWTAFQRIDNDSILGNANGCHDFLARAENMTGMWSTGASIPMPVEQSIHGWIYILHNEQKSFILLIKVMDDF